ncbi:MAG: DUF1294 domain-containing protein [Streptococcus sp.]
MSVKGMITGLILLWNLFVGILYGVDKEKAKRNDWRIPEKTLLFYAFAVGGLGAWTGGLLFHHKAQKWYFKVNSTLLRNAPPYTHLLRFLYGGKDGRKIYL